MLRLSYPRRQHYRRLRRAAASGTAGLAIGVMEVIAATAGALPVAGVPVLVTSGLVIDARRWLRLARRSRIGARSEDEVRRALAPLEGEGWRLRHSLPYRGRGDIDSVAIAPTGIVFAIEIKTKMFDARHLATVEDMAAWLYRRRRRWCRRGALPVLCVVRARRMERIEDGVLIVSVDRLVRSLRATAGTAHRPTLLDADQRVRTCAILAEPAPAPRDVNDRHWMNPIARRLAPSALDRAIAQSPLRSCDSRVVGVRSDAPVATPSRRA